MGSDPHPLTCRPLSAAQLLDEKEQYEHGTGRPLRRKDLESVELLRRLVKRERDPGSR